MEYFNHPVLKFIRANKFNLANAKHFKLHLKINKKHFKFIYLFI